MASICIYVSILITWCSPRWIAYTGPFRQPPNHSICLALLPRKPSALPPRESHPLPPRIDGIARPRCATRPMSAPTFYGLSPSLCPRHPLSTVVVVAPPLLRPVPELAAKHIISFRRGHMPAHTCTGRPHGCLCPALFGTKIQPTPPRGRLTRYVFGDLAR
jgi:hypothetical protein